MVETIWTVVNPYLPVLASFAVTHGLKWWKAKINKENPFLWWLVSVVGNLIVAGGGSVAMGADEASAGLNALLSQGIAQGYHAYDKNKRKKAESVKPVEG